jgi:hypothetical protein
MRKPNRKTFITSLALLLFLHFAAASLNAQEAYKIDEAKNPRCDLSEVPPVDPPPGGKFAKALYDNPDLRGAIVVYGLQGNAEPYARQIKDRLVEFAGVDGQRLSTLYGGHLEGSRLELWIVPKGAAEPKSNFAEDTKAARKFARYIYWNGEYCSSGRLSALTMFGKKLKELTAWQGYIVIHPHINKRGTTIADDGWDPDGYVSRRQALRRIAKDKSYLIKKFGLSPARIKAIVGDNSDWTHAELWLVPPGAELPISKAQSLTGKR